MTAPQYPAGPFAPDERYSEERRQESITVLEQAPAVLRAAIAGLTEEQLDTPYRNWSIRQIVHHLADSHVNAYVRFKLALTEDRPTIKPYDEGRWVALEDSRSGSLAAPLTLLEGLHASWVQLLRSMTVEQYARSYFHPEMGEEVPLFQALGSYAWHSCHHTGQILWLREQRGWKQAAAG
jgi:hypothetical protein